MGVEHVAGHLLALGAVLLKVPLVGDGLAGASHAVAVDGGEGSRAARHPSADLAVSHSCRVMPGPDYKGVVAHARAQGHCGQLRPGAGSCRWAVRLDPVAYVVPVDYGHHVRHVQPDLDVASLIGAPVGVRPDIYAVYVVHRQACVFNSHQSRLIGPMGLAPVEIAATHCASRPYENGSLSFGPLYWHNALPSLFCRWSEIWVRLKPQDGSEPPQLG